MEMTGFMLLVIGIFIALFAKRIILSKMILEEKDKKEIELLATGAILAVRLVGIILAVIGILFLAI